MQSYKFDAKNLKIKLKIYENKQNKIGSNPPKRNLNIFKTGKYPQGEYVPIHQRGI